MNFGSVWYTKLVTHQLAYLKHWRRYEKKHCIVCHNICTLDSSL